MLLSQAAPLKGHDPYAYHEDAVMWLRMMPSSRIGRCLQCGQPSDTDPAAPGKGESNKRQTIVAQYVSLSAGYVVLTVSRLCLNDRK